MIIATKFFGDIEIKPQDILEFPGGLPGFEDVKRFVLLNMEEKGIYQVLQSIDQPQVALIVTNPYLFLKDYSFDLDGKTLELLEIESPKDVIILSIVTLRTPFSETTVNLQAPVVVNYNRNKGKQVILNDTFYHTKHLLASFRKEEKQHVSAESENK